MSRLDCLDILTADPTAPDDIYWIDPTGTDAYEVYCDMTTDGGGWTLVMKAINDNFLYLDTIWTSTGLANETDLSLTASGTAKYQSYNEVPFTELRTSDNTVLTTDLVESFGTTQSSALALFSSSGTVLDTIHNSYFDSRAPTAHKCLGLHPEPIRHQPRRCPRLHVPSRQRRHAVRPQRWGPVGTAPTSTTAAAAGSSTVRDGHPMAAATPAHRASIRGHKGPTSTPSTS